MKTFRKNWNKRNIEDWGCYCSKEYKSFCRAFKNYLKRAFPNAELTGFTANHYDTSGFITENGVCVYVSHSIDRGKGYVDFDESGCINGVLYRIAKDTKDYHGKTNHFSSMTNLEMNIKELMNIKARYI